MTDVTATKSAFAGRDEAARSRMARRYAAERRFRLYGIVAILVTAAFVAVLLLDIVWKGLPAFSEHRLLLNVNASQEALDPQRTGDIDTIRKGDFDSIIRAKVRDLLPSVESRSDRKLLLGLLSSGAADDFRSLVIADPALVGKDVKITALLSDDADQYLKGYQTRVERRPGHAALTIAPEGEFIRIATDGADFASAMADIRDFVSRDIAIKQRELSRLDVAVADLDRKLELAEESLAATDAGDQVAIAAATAERDKLAVDLQALTGNRDALKAKVDALSARLGQSAGPQQLDASFPSYIIEAGGGAFKAVAISENAMLAEVILPTATQSAATGQWNILTLETPESSRRTTDREAVWLETLKTSGAIEKGFAWRFITSGDSREAELAGIKGAFVGSVLTLIVTLVICLPLGVGAAVYLEEFAPTNRLTDLIEININNLAAVPSIVFGLLGLAMFLNFFGLPRSAPLVGGLVLALLVLPTIIIASRAALKAVPPSIKEAALGVGASHQQAIFHHVLPLAIPGIMTGTIIGMAHALGETAPLLMIGMVAFIVDVPHGITEAATAMPVQIYLWSDLPEIAFQAKTAAAIIVLLGLLFAMNALAIYTRKRFERRW
jgi:phosphate transport system permease protein